MAGIVSIVVIIISVNVRNVLTIVCSALPTRGPPHGHSLPTTQRRSEDNPAILASSVKLCLEKFIISIETVFIDTIA